MDTLQDRKLLTIAIPTFNRASYLDQCLQHICGQLKKDEDRVEILISDNNSTDNTSEIVNKYISQGFVLNYLKNNENIGSDMNFVQCFNLAKGKYILILGDDDVLLENAIGNILEILEKDDYGIVFLNSYSFANDFVKERPKAYFTGYKVYANAAQFIRKIRYIYFIAFISVNVVNKSFVSRDLKPDQFAGTNLVHLGWTLSALFNANKNVFLKEYSVAAKLYNSGGYKLCEVFGVNYNKIFDAFISQGLESKYFKIINKKLLMKFFPAHIIRLRKNMINLKNENYYKVLYPLFRGYANFWIFTLPAIVLPLKIAYSLFSFMNFARRFTVTIRSVLDRYFLL
jgi:glycosyltransferase involved in cell wall biosynthesis